MIDTNEDIIYSGKKINDYIEEKMSLSIISNEVTERECYNDYMIKLENPILIHNLAISELQTISPSAKIAHPEKSIRKGVKNLE